ncbi:MAG: hypothetical protein AB8G99_26210 [Planctomycetaceae bacterium]
MRAILLRGVVCASVALVLSGCSGDAVVEDRTIQFGSTGSTSFQHGPDGVFIDIDGESRRIFEADDDVLATSSPRWSPDKKRVLFAVAKRFDENQGQGSQNWNDAPDGRVFGRNGDVQYDLYLYEPGDEQAKPQKLFSSSVRHVGYIAADLVAKWLPDGSGIAFIAANSSQQHELKQLNLLSKAEKKAYPHAADWLIFDFVPGSSDFVICAEDSKRTGVWIGSNGTDWWRVTDARGPQRLQLSSNSIASMFNAIATSDSPLERLRGLMPVWSNDSRQLAFVTHSESGGTSKQPATHKYEVHIASLQEKQVDRRYESTEPVYEVKWAHDSQSVGLLHSVSQRPALSSLPVEGGKLTRLTDRSVHSFAGWNNSGSDRAMIVPTRELRPRNDWAFVLTPTYPGRETLVVSDETRDREVFSGTRITFPNWSEDGKSLSFWATFTPSHRTWMNMAGGGGVRNGDPAVTVDIETGEIHWMPVSAIEKLQIGHYHLLKGNAKESLRWYDEALPDLPEMNSSNQEHLLAAHVYRAISNETLGQTEAADQAMSEFDAATNKALDEAIKDFDDEGLKARRQQLPTVAVVSKYALLLEAYVSVDAVELCEARIRKMVAVKDGADADKLMQSIVLSQTLLLQSRHDDYIRLVTEALLPQAFRLFGDQSIKLSQMEMERPLLFQTQLSLLPLFAPEFLKQVQPEALSKLCEHVEELRAEDPTDPVAVVLDTMLVRLYSARNDPAEVRATQNRLKQLPGSSKLDSKSLENAIRFLRCFPDLSSLEEPK